MPNGLLSAWGDYATTVAARWYELSQLLGQQTTVTAPTYGPTIATDCQQTRHVQIVATDTVAYTISNPTNPAAGRELTFDIKNSSGGTMGVVTWGTAFKLDSNGFTNPANGKHRVISYRYDGTIWVQLGATTGDIT